MEYIYVYVCGVCVCVRVRACVCVCKQFQIKFALDIYKTLQAVSKRITRM